MSIYTGKIYDCYFYNIHQTGDGGAIKIISTDAKPEIIYCRFETISIDGSGGSIYLSTSKSRIQSSIFYKTYSTEYENDVIIGNALYLESETEFNNNYIALCGFIENQCCDSTLRINQKSTIQYYNATNNRGIGGGSGFSLRDAPDSTVEYINIVDSLDNYAFEDDNLENRFSYLNVINSTCCNKAIIYLTQDDVLTLNECVFIDCHQTFSTPKTKITFINCKSNKNLESISYTAQPITNIVILKFKTEEINTCKNGNLNSIIYFIFVFIFISIKI